MRRMIADSASVDIAGTREREHMWNWALILPLTLCLAFWSLIIVGLTVTVV